MRTTDQPVSVDPAHPWVRGFGDDDQEFVRPVVDIYAGSRAYMTESDDMIGRDYHANQSHT